MATFKAERPGRVLTAITSALLVLAVPATSPAQGQDATFTRPLGRTFVPGEIIVKIKPGEAGLADPSAAVLQGVQRARENLTSGGEVLFRVQSAPPEGLVAPTSAAEVKATTLQAIDDIRRRADVEYAEPNYLMYPLATTDDPRFPEQWDYRVRGNGAGQSPGGIGLTEVWDTNTGSADVVVAVIDTGVVRNHGDIAGSANQAGGIDMISHDFVANDGDRRDDNPDDPGDAVAANECMSLGSPPHAARGASWHGTHVAGTIGVGGTNNGKSIAGVNWRVKLLSVRALGRCGGTLVDIADAIRWAAGIAVPGISGNPTPARVINMSLGGEGACSPVYQRAIDDAVARGAIVVVAAGNEHTDAAGAQPASCRNVITVGASDEAGRFASRFSNFGSVVDIIAPGDRILSLVRGGEAFYSGTSMATPHVAGVVALWLAQHPEWGHDQVEDALRRNAVPRDASHGCGPNRCGAGLLSAKLGHVPTGGSTASLSLAPSEILLDSRATERAVSATVRSNGQPRATAAVTFTVANPQVASVVPSTTQTNASGEATVLVRSQGGPGQTMLTAQSGTASAAVPVTVPSGSTMTAFAAALGIMVTEWWRRRNRGSW